MRPVAGRWWRWLRGHGPLEILPARPLPAIAAWVPAPVIGWALGGPLTGHAAHLALALLVEALLVAGVLLAARRRNLLEQGLQAAGLLAGLRTLALAPVPTLLLVADAGAGPGAILGVFALLALAALAATVWLVRRYLALWRQALRVGPGRAGAVLLGLTLAMLVVEVALARALPFAAAPAPAWNAAAVAAGLR